MVADAPIDVAALMAMLRKDVLARAEHPRDINIRIDSPAQLLGSESEVHSAFSNLVDNAAKYTPSQGSIEMRWWTDERGRAFRGHGHRHRHSAGAHSASHRALLPRRSGPLARHRRLGIGTCDREARPAAPCGDVGDPKAPWGPGARFTCHFPPRARRDRSRKRCVKWFNYLS